MTMTAIMMIVMIKISLTMFDDNKGEDKVRKFMRFHCETSQANDIGAFANSLLTSYVLSYRQLSPYLRFSRSQRVTNPKISVRPSLWNLLELFLAIISSVQNLLSGDNSSSSPSSFSFSFLNCTREQSSKFIRIASHLIVR